MSAHRHRLIYLRRVWSLYDDYYTTEWSGKFFMFRLFRMIRKFCFPGSYRSEEL